MNNLLCCNWFGTFGGIAEFIQNTEGVFVSCFDALNKRVRIWLVPTT